MSTSLTTLLRLSPPRAKKRKTGGTLKGRALAADDPFAAVAGRPGICFTLPSNISLLVERKCLLSLVASVALYAVAALVANEWLYLLSAAVALAAIVGTIMPILIVCSAQVDAWMPEYGAYAEGVEATVRIRQNVLLGPIRHLLPLSFLRTRIILARRTGEGYVAEQTLADQCVLLERCGYQALAKFRIPSLARGVYKLSHVDLTSCMPFGFAWAIKSHKLSDEKDAANTVIVMPSRVELRGDFLLALKGIFASVGLSFTSMRAFSQSTSVRGIREFRTGDSLRHIHWPSSARMNRLLVREFDSETLPVFNLFLDLRAKWQNRQQFELAVCVAYSLVHYGNEHDMLPELFVRPDLESEDLESLMIDLPMMQTPLDMLGEILARVEPLPSRGRSSRELDFGSRYQVIAIEPSKDTVLRTTDKGDVSVAPVNLIAIDGHGSRAADGILVATVYGERDLEAL